MATVTVETYKVLTPEEAEARRKRVSAIIRDIEYKLALDEETSEMEERKTSE
jgi:hypothetical protein